MSNCHRAPNGWRCTRGFLHQGPCAAIRANPIMRLLDLWRNR